MFAWRRKPGWLINPSKVAFGSVVERPGRNLSRSHVRVEYGREAEVRFEPVAAFARRCRETLLDGRSLDIESLLVAPIVKQRHASFFDSLTDWGPATRRARRSRPAAARPG